MSQQPLLQEQTQVQLLEPLQALLQQVQQPQQALLVLVFALRQPLVRVLKQKSRQQEPAQPQGRQPQAR